MDNINNKICAKFNSKSTWVTLWFFALAGLLFSLRAVSLIRPKTCIVLCAISVLFSVFGTLVGLSAGRTRLEIGEKFIYCKKLFGKQMYIPTYSVTGIKTGFFGTVCITSPSFKIRCMFVKNREEIICALKEKLEGRE